ncbi:hypothetical protein ATCC51562_1520 [Campylobacter concisus ATCC 51562]|uniref:Uncharacterized protein n=1 Tax=Campylobacter concisus ATCC 51562 TaxID=1242969 RepID=U2F465_9BACT|nr:hypothetical protein ATCC51562_1520 [Campylobacter concisus ATCC 51562]
MVRMYRAPVYAPNELRTAKIKQSLIIYFIALNVSSRVG